MVGRRLWLTVERLGQRACNFSICFLLLLALHNQTGDRSIAIRVRKLLAIFLSKSSRQSK
jgi:hypothetical protein